MSAPERWLDSADAPAGAAELLRAASPVVIPPEARQRLAGRVRKLAAAPPVGIATLLTTKLAVAGTVGVASIAAVMASGLTTELPLPQAQRPAQLERAVQIPSARLSIAPPPIEEVIAIEALPTEALPTEALSTQKPKQQHREPAHAPEVDTLAAETQLVSAMQAALAQGSPDRALELARIHDQRYPNGQLRATAGMLETRALDQLGRGADARERARALVEREPSSVHSAEAVKILADR